MQSHRPDSIGVRFDGGPNALNFIRLCLALEVVTWHAYALRGSDWLPAHVGHLMADIAVDSFFGISGFLCIYAGIHLGKYPQLRLRNDLSYGAYVYGFPIQQAFLVSGVAMGWFGFAALSIAEHCRLQPCRGTSWSVE